jgi:hypothetical protein
MYSSSTTNMHRNSLKLVYKHKDFLHFSANAKGE